MTVREVVERRSVRTLILTGAGATALLMPGFAQAQQAAETDLAEAEGNEIIVTATKREKTLQDVPVAVSVTTAETIERAHIRDVSDLVSVVPSLRVVQLQGSQQTNFFIRGFGNGSNNVGVEPSVGVFVDGVFRSRTASQIGDFPDIQRVEVLRGPQSTLFGKNASAGVISIVTREPQFTFGGAAEASYGNFDAKVLKGYVTGPLAESLAFSLAAGVNKRDGFAKDLGSDTRTNERNRWFVRGQMLFQPDDQLKIRVIGDYDKIDENCCGVVNLLSSDATRALQHPLIGGKVSDPAHPFADKVYGNLPSTNKIENYGFSAQVDYDTGPFKLTSITAFRRTNAINDQDSDFTSARLLATNLEDKHLRSFSQEFRVAGDLTDSISALFGVFYLNEKFRQHGELYLDDQFRTYADLLIRGNSGGALNVGALEGAFGALEGAPNKYLGTFFTDTTGQNIDLSLKSQSLSIFGQFDVELTDRLTLTVGGNYTRDKKKFATDVTSHDTFSAINFDAPQYAPLRYQLLYQGALGNGLSEETAAAFAAARMNNPLANPLGPLRTFQLFPPFVNVPNAVEDGKTNDDNFSYTLRLAYDATDHVNLYASYATGFKASSINLSRDSRPPASLAGALASAGELVSNLHYGTRLADPEKSKVFELGAKGSWRNYSANLAVFYQEIKGFQSNIFLGTGFALSNAGKQSTYGVEFEGTARPIPPLTLGVSITWLDPKYNSFIASAVGDQSGRRPPEIPEWSTTFSAQWDQDLGSGNHLILRGSYHYESTAWAVEGLPGFIKRDAAGNVVSYAPAIEAASKFKRQVDEVDASLTFAMENGLELSVWGRNLLNDRYFNRVFDSVAQPLAVSGYLNQPRTYGVGARFKW
ncbi:putative TonB-dependent receptor [Caenibius tardaugens NBRC 16725]|uniref:Putative TonB-dependent receptor n=1 Tax=Caenibius tardaugens NBRC 16725 TaxID=1219035 RepID=U2YIF9_9SPHN|nr:TonB-dependent receptor [Caenibius tardaugens]AZI36930.1 TonB-dependent receptor [Caenibius tardaugens NBRC 16725]GAD47862.1 putative TonB-dependent receptor [Caenibius tardaugens NBRC 16725]